MTTKIPGSQSPDDTLKTAPVRPAGTVMDMELAGRVATAHETIVDDEKAYYQNEIFNELVAIGYTEEFAREAVRFYTLAYNHCGNLLLARQKISQYCTLRLAGEMHDAVCKKVLASLPQNTVVVDDATLVANAASATPDATFVEPAQGFDAFDGRWDDASRAPISSVNARAATRNEVVAVIPTVLAPVTPIEAIVQQLSTGVDAGRADTVLEANVRGDVAFNQALTEQRLACRQLLITEGYSPEIAEEGAVFYHEKLKTFGIPARIMQETRVYCQQRKLGASIVDATLAAQGKMIGIPEHDDAMDANLERAMNANRERGVTRNRILMVVGAGVLLAGVIGGAYYLGAHRGETPVVTPPTSQP